MNIIHINGILQNTKQNSREQYRRVENIIGRDMNFCDFMRFPLWNWRRARSDSPHDQDDTTWASFLFFQNDQFLEIFFFICYDKINWKVYIRIIELIRDGVSFCENFLREIRLWTLWFLAVDISFYFINRFHISTVYNTRSYFQDQVKVKIGFRWNYCNRWNYRYQRIRSDSGCIL